MSDTKESDGFSGVACDWACQSTSFHFFPFGHWGATMKQGYFSWSASICLTPCLSCAALSSPRSPAPWRKSSSGSRLSAVAPFGEYRRYSSFPPGPEYSLASSCWTGSWVSRARTATRKGIMSSSGQQDRRPGRLPGLEIAVGLRGLPQGIGLVDRNLHDLLFHDVEQLFGGLKQILALRRVGEERGPGQEERP